MDLKVFQKRRFGHHIILWNDAIKNSSTPYKSSQGNPLSTVEFLSIVKPKVQKDCNCLLWTTHRPVSNRLHCSTIERIGYSCYWSYQTVSFILYIVLQLNLLKTVSGASLSNCGYHKRKASENTFAKETNLKSLDFAVAWPQEILLSEGLATTVQLFHICICFCICLATHSKLLFSLLFNCFLFFFKMTGDYSHVVSTPTVNKFNAWNKWTTIFNQQSQKKRFKMSFTWSKIATWRETKIHRVSSVIYPWNTKFRSA